MHFQDKILRNACQIYFSTLILVIKKFLEQCQEAISFLISHTKTHTILWHANDFMAHSLCVVTVVIQSKPYNKRVSGSYVKSHRFEIFNCHQTFNIKHVFLPKHVRVLNDCFWLWSSFLYGPGSRKNLCWPPYVAGFNCTDANNSS